MNSSIQELFQILFMFFGRVMIFEARRYVAFSEINIGATGLAEEFSYDKNYSIRNFNISKLYSNFIRGLCLGGLLCNAIPISVSYFNFAASLLIVWHCVFPLINNQTLFIKSNPKISHFFEWRRRIILGRP